MNGMQIEAKGVERKSRPGFTLVEMMAAAVILAILMALLFPVIGTIRHEKNAIQCATNLRSLLIVFAAYATDHSGRLPPGNVANPSTFKYDDALVLDEYMKQNGLPPDLFHCPGLLEELPEDSVKTPKYWLSTEVPHYTKYRETMIGYFYLGNPTRNIESSWKIRQPLPEKFGQLSPLTGESMPFIFDKISGPRPGGSSYGPGSSTEDSPQSAEGNPDLTSPHRSFSGRPSGGNLGLSSGAVIRKAIKDMHLGYTYVSPRDVYW